MTSPSPKRVRTELIKEMLLFNTILHRCGSLVIQCTRINCSKREVFEIIVFECVFLFLDCSSLGTSISPFFIHKIYPRKQMNIPSTSFFETSTPFLTPLGNLALFAAISCAFAITKEHAPPMLRNLLVSYTLSLSPPIEGAYWEKRGSS